MSDPGDQIAAAVNAMADPEPDACPHCNGDGWYVGHEAECFPGDCQCSGVQVQCECVGPST